MNRLSVGAGFVQPKEKSKTQLPSITDCGVGKKIVRLFQVHEKRAEGSKCKLWCVKFWLDMRKTSVGGW